MNTKNDQNNQRRPQNPGPQRPQETRPQTPTEDPSKGAAKGTFFSRFSEMLQTNRGPEHPPEAEPEIPAGGSVSADDLALRRAKAAAPAGPKRMLIPEGVLIGGPITSAVETEIGGRVDGDVTVDGRLFLSNTAVISGNVRAAVCRVEGLVEGKVDCSQDLDLGPTGRLNADVIVGKRVTVAGQVKGSVSTQGMLRLVSTGKVEGNIHTKQVVIEEGAVFNGSCIMRIPGTPGQRNGQ